MKNVREIALDILLRVEKSKSFSHLLISNSIEQENMSLQDEKLLTEIVYGTIERKLTLAYYLQPFLSKQKKISPWVEQLLQLSLFQMIYLDKIPTYAIINEAVEIAKKKGHQGTGRLVNGVLRAIDRKGVADLTEITDEVEQLSIKTSHPRWLVERWIDLYGFDETQRMCEMNLINKPITFRINLVKTDEATVLERLTREGIEVERSLYLQNCFIVKSGNIIKTPLIQEGLITVQDQASMLASEIVDAKAGMDILDTCSAPGGKATYLAEKMGNEGMVYAHDLHKNKISLLEKNKLRLGLNNMITKQYDARNLQELYEAKQFDRILIDAPCSGLGVIRSKPDIKYNKQLSDIENLRKIQLDILKKVQSLLKDDGKIIYCTCTVDVLENEKVIEEFLKGHQQYKVDKDFLNEMKKKLNHSRITAYGLQLFPQTINSDGFFMTRLVKH